ncbi:SDR family oxidoreductase [Paraconexibacter antarcticus]|uniref:SDR family oxidoreductase n=1 Tax=Paraconexibacter antarcticus TaxID=2949664 RepID=A0ABY5E0Q5_9ACTN|nr:SDR family oxidoreductase [Paraconexibacter antarcticus]UTI66682.1 SDR family oxidoreductase [Paraconexibacter antarcticus]
MQSSKTPLRGRVAAVTGAARGIGRATAAALVREGVAVAIGDLDLALAEQTARELGNGTLALRLDVTSRASVRAFLDEVEDRLGPLDVLVNNAGIMLVGRPLWEEDDEAARRQYEVNVNGTLYGIKEAVPRFRARGHGHIVNVASGAGLIGFAGGGSYCGTKHYVIGVSEALRAELRGSGVEVSCVMPAVVNTELASGGGAVRGLRSVEPEQVADAIVNAVKGRRFDVYVPRELEVLDRLQGLLPRRVFEALLRLSGGADLLIRIDTAARAEYERRAFASAGAVDDEPWTVSAP